MEFFAFLLLVGVVVAFVQIFGLKKRLDRAEQELRVMRLRLGRPVEAPAPSAAPVAPVARTAAAETPAPGPAAPERPAPYAAHQATEIPASQPMAPPQPPPFIPPRLAKKAEGPSWELKLGAQWMAWAGGLLFLIGIAWFMKYAYTNNWVDPRGRLAIGMAVGAAALVGAEIMRRRGYDVLFQAVTGAGIAIFYTCVYFSFQVYALTGPTASMIMACVVTGSAIVLAVAHNAVAIAILALLGGFLSPVLLGTDENHPYILFLYVTILDLVALCVAYFRRWRGLDILAFAGTTLLYQGWHARYYAPDQLVPALIFTTLFYLLFLIIPTLHSLVRRQPEQWDGLTLVVANAVYALLAYYQALYADHRMALGFVAVGQAALVFALARTWDMRVGRGTKTGESLLIIAMALVTLAIPLELRLYGIPIAWAVEGALFAYLGTRFDRLSCRIAGVAAVVLAAGGLFYRLPLHPLPFIPVVNPPFGSWLLVIVAASIVTYLLRNDREVLPYIAAFTAYVLLCMLLTLEIFEYWDDSEAAYRHLYMFDCFAVLWSIIPAAAVLAWLRLRRTPILIVAYVACFFTSIVAFGGFANYEDYPSVVPLLNLAFLPYLLIVAAFWWMGILLRRHARPIGGITLNVLGHVALAMLLALELERWSRASGVLSEKMALGLLSGVWAVQALTLVIIGLTRRDRVRRILGLVFFVIILVKVVFLDAAQLEEVYRILSWLLSGLVFLAGAYVYQRFSISLDSEKPEGEAADR